MTPKQHALHLRQSELGLKFAIEREVRLAMEAGAAMAKGFVGHPQEGWDPLAPATLSDKARKGYEVPAPLKRTGELAESFVGEAEAVPGGVRGVIASTSEHAPYSEIGTSREPPRPALVPAMILAEPIANSGLLKLGVRALTPGQKL